MICLNSNFLNLLKIFMIIYLCICICIFKMGGIFVNIGKVYIIENIKVLIFVNKIVLLFLNNNCCNKNLNV